MRTSHGDLADESALFTANDQSVNWSLVTGLDAERAAVRRAKPLPFRGELGVGAVVWTRALRETDSPHPTLP